MKNIELFSPCGKASIFCHPAKVEEMKKTGWSEKKAISKTESKLKKEDK